MRIGLLTAYHLGEEITIQGQSSNGKEFTLTGTLLDVEHNYTDDDFVKLFEEFIDPLGDNSADVSPDEVLEEKADEADEDLDDDENADAGSELVTEISLRLSGTTEITIELPAHHEVTVEPSEDDERDD